jgi:hypothetical protein
VNIYKLGKKPVKVDHRTLQMSRYRTTAPIEVPAEVSWVTKLSNLGEMLNDQIGDCTVAAAGHMIQQWSTYAAQPVIVPDSAILTAYEDPSVGNYSPNDPNTDNGAAMLDVLKYWRKTGIGGHKIAAFVQVNPRNALEVREAVLLFGNVYMGAQLPASVQGADAWTVPDGGTSSPDGMPGSWGGHCVPICAVSPETLTCITWGSLLKMSHGFFADYVDEAYAVLSTDWIEKNGISPSQFNLAQLDADLRIVTG